MATIITATATIMGGAAAAIEVSLDAEPGARRSRLELQTTRCALQSPLHTQAMNGPTAPQFGRAQ
jgi:hypothetical protein